MTTVYVAHPIDQRPSNAEPNGLVMEVNDELSRQGFSSYWPRAPWHFDGGVDWGAVHRVNCAVQPLLDATVAVLPHEMPTLGTPAEIEKALAIGQPVAIVTPLIRTVQIQGWASEGAIVDGSARSALLRLGGAIDAKGTHKEGKEALRVQVDAGARGVLPTRMYEGDAGFDLYVSEDTKIAGGQWVDVPMGIRVELPPTMWCMIVGRSSTWRRKHIDVKSSIIDSGYRGPIFAACQNIGDLPVIVKAGERVAQLIPMRLEAPGLAVQAVNRLQSSDRGDLGFGSSGV